ncbi:MAG: 23S rRNA (adenine(2503)-C(2))-methyltransferase RlmN [Lachnospiraceae bacterium]|nr:23S rRNA (adenine(2503)-C(2))-methyltransferase RlmN [Lachnospiraceae bacterium]
MDNYKCLKDFSLSELEALMEEIGEKKFRAKQIYEWLHVKLCESYEDMTNIPKALKEKLAKDYTVSAAKISITQVSKRGDTKKYLMVLNDNNTLESVWMKHKHGNSVCVSSQVGCRMGCRFCASTANGLVRSLSVAEMLEQVYNITRETGERVDNIIIMGMGEPLDNYDNVINFIRRITEKGGLNISERSITLSTCGLVENIRRLAEEGLSITLAISLHAPDDEKRKLIMPIANKYSIKEIFEATDYYIEKTKRRVSVEYTLIKGDNDTKECAMKLTRLLKGKLYHVNLIPLNQVEGRYGKRSIRENIEDFKILLEKNRINVTIRREMGGDIDAACGQLRNNKMNQ